MMQFRLPLRRSARDIVVLVCGGRVAGWQGGVCSTASIPNYVAAILEKQAGGVQFTPP